MDPVTVPVQQEQSLSPNEASAATTSTGATPPQAVQRSESESKSRPKPWVQVVIARYMENIAWSQRDRFRALDKVIYNKGKDLTGIDLDAQTTVHRLENVGRECHTFIHHIVQHYNDLPDVVIFLPGSCHDPNKVGATLSLMDKVRSTGTTVLDGWFYEDVSRQLSNFRGPAVWEGTNAQNQQFMPSSACAPALVRPFGAWYRRYFGNIKTQVVCFGSRIAVAREHIIQKPLSHYQALLECLQNHSNPEDGHFMERSWQAVFYPLPRACLYYAQSNVPTTVRPVAQAFGGVKPKNAMEALAKYKTIAKKVKTVDAQMLVPEKIVVTTDTPNIGMNGVDDPLLVTTGSDPLHISEPGVDDNTNNLIIGASNENPLVGVKRKADVEN